MHPFPWRGEGPWVGVEAPSYEEGVGVVGTTKPKAWPPKKKVGFVGTSKPSAWTSKKKVEVSRRLGSTVATE